MNTLEEGLDKVAIARRDGFEVLDVCEKMFKQITLFLLVQISTERAPFLTAALMTLLRSHFYRALRKVGET